LIILWIYGIPLKDLKIIQKKIFLTAKSAKKTQGKVLSEPLHPLRINIFMDLRYPLKRPKNYPKKDLPNRQERKGNARKFLCEPLRTFACFAV
jgi:hypothetical protein